MMNRAKTQEGKLRIIKLDADEYARRIRNTDKILWHSVKREGYPPVKPEGVQCEASDFLLLTILEHDYFTKHLNEHICLGIYRRDWYNGIWSRDYPEVGWVDDAGNIIENARVTHWAVAPKPRKERKGE